MKATLSLAHAWMREYMHSFYEEDTELMWGIKLKEIHTGYVTANCLALAKELTLDEHTTELCEFIGLFHDVGRFQQWKLYRTFRDNLSEDHADLGLKVLVTLPFFQQLPNYDRELILFAIKNHNKKYIAATTDTQKLLLAKIIRDADKLDIFRINLERVTVPPTHTLDKHCKELFNAAQPLSTADIKSMDDLKLLYLLWVYDIYFSWTMKKIKDKGFIDKIVHSLPQDEDITTGLTRMYACMEGKLQFKAT